MITVENIGQIAEWCGGKVVTEEDALNPSVTNPALNVDVAGTVKRVRPGDILIQNHDGTFQIHEF